MNLVLASGSPRRKELLEEMGLEFTVFTADFNEATVKLDKPEEGVQKLAAGKAIAALKKWKTEKREPGALFLGADTIVVLDGVPMGKPISEADAFATLKRLSGQKHQVYTGVAFVTETSVRTFFVKTDVYFYDLTDDEIYAYIATGEPMDKAGSYGIQGQGRLLVKKIDGDYFNVVGLPVAETCRRLQKIN